MRRFDLTRRRYWSFELVPEWPRPELYRFVDRGWFPLFVHIVFWSMPAAFLAVGGIAVVWGAASVGAVQQIGGIIGVLTLLAFTALPFVAIVACGILRSRLARVIEVNEETGVVLVRPTAYRPGYSETYSTDDLRVTEAIIMVSGLRHVFLCYGIVLRCGLHVMLIAAYRNGLLAPWPSIGDCQVHTLASQYLMACRVAFDRVGFTSPTVIST
jgi:hypothetical protein